MVIQISEVAVEQARRRVWVSGPRLSKLIEFAKEVLIEYEKQVEGQAIAPIHAEAGKTDWRFGQLLRDYGKAAGEVAMFNARLRPRERKTRMATAHPTAVEAYFRAVLHEKELEIQRLQGALARSEGLLLEPGRCLNKVG